ncbi:MAG: hypothetical protein LCH41_08855 [Armatimonadetes bacterium]|nr:hypothetical protein [Armatimonadota bacterium]
MMTALSAPLLFHAALQKTPPEARIRQAWETEIKAADPAWRSDLQHLLKHSSPADVQNLNPKTVAEMVRLAHKAGTSVAWRKQIPTEIWQDYVVPPWVITEPRDFMRRDFQAKYLGKVKEMKNPGEAAMFINQHLFADYKVVYNTRRLRTDQSSRESIKQGMATCTGLSVMLIEACRAVGIPARFVGIASWPGSGGNHSWVEVWDGKSWRFVGAAEHDPAGLDRAWFTDRAKSAKESIREEAIWAVAFRATGQTFPAAWAPQAKLNGINVTKRYAGEVVDTRPKLRVVAFRKGVREATPILVTNLKTGEVILNTMTLQDPADVNLHAEVAVDPGTTLTVVASQNLARVKHVTVSSDTLVRFDLDEAPKAEELDDLIRKALNPSTPENKATLELLKSVAWDDSLKQRVWDLYKSSINRDEMKADFDQKVVRTSDRTAPFLWRTVGEKPAGGWGLVFALHGGGGTTQEFNDQQWRGMFERYYKDHPEAGGYIYCALRAPNNEWNGFYDDSIAPLVRKLIESFVLFEGVNPNLVSMTGASHGGYGTFVIAPKMPDRFAAANASASAPSPGETQLVNLMNLPFTWVIGENDTAYGRADRCKEAQVAWEALRAEHGTGFKGGMEWLPGVGHSVPDRDKVRDLRAFTRDVTPDKFVWAQTDATLQGFYWLHDPSPKDGEMIAARVESAASGSTFIISSAAAQNDLVLLPQLSQVTQGKPVTIRVSFAGKERSVLVSTEPTLGNYIQSLLDRGDPDLASPLRIVAPTAE